MLWKIWNDYEVTEKKRWIIIFLWSRLNLSWKWRGAVDTKRYKLYVCGKSESFDDSIFCFWLYPINRTINKVILISLCGGFDDASKKKVWKVLINSFFLARQFLELKKTWIFLCTLKFNVFSYQLVSFDHICMIFNIFYFKFLHKLRFLHWKEKIWKGKFYMLWSLTFA